MKKTFFILIVTCCCVGLAAAQDTGRLAGENTVFDSSEEAFTHPLPLLSANEIERFEAGDEVFEEIWRGRNGLGPVFNAESCESCHLEDGRGRPPAFVGETQTGLLIRLAQNIQNANGSTIPDPVYGGQFQDEGLGQLAEGTLAVRYQTIQGTYTDGTAYTLYAPTYELTNLRYGALHPNTTLSPRLAGQMIGLGLLEAVPAETILALADPNDVNGDGISGRPNYVWNSLSNSLSLGRFGWKANQPTLLQQSAGAFNGDIGITSNLNPTQPCTDAQSACLERVLAEALVQGNLPPNQRGNQAPPPPPRNPQNGNNDGRRGNPPDNQGNNDGRRGNPPDNQGNNDGRRGNPPNQGNRNGRNQSPFEASDEDLALVTFYSSTIAVPAQRNPQDAQVQAGAQLFETIQCATCHVSSLQTGNHPINALTNQTIQPYTDLLLHDMGTGLADGQVDFQASGTEWRTAPLWGIGLLETVNGYAYYLHDGRARSLEEAILWHGGEAQASRDAFINMSSSERQALISFLKSL